MFEEIYRDFKGELPEGYDILDGWISNCSLGETHSVTMCFITGCSIFLSDDKGAVTLKDILMRKRAFNLDVYNRDAAIQRLKELKGGLNKKEILFDIGRSNGLGFQRMRGGACLLSQIQESESILSGEALECHQLGCGREDV